MNLQENLLHRDSSEKSVLGAITEDNSLIDEISQLVKPHMFHNGDNRAVYEAMLRLRDSGTDINSPTIFQEIIKMGKADKINAYTVSTCTPYSSPRDAMYFATTIADTYIKEEVVKIAERIKAKASTDTSDGFELVSTAISALEETTNVVSGSDRMSSLAEVLDEMMSIMDEPVLNGVSGVPSGLGAIDDLTGGWQNGNLIIIAGRAGMGKSAFTNTIINNAAMQGFPCALWSLEMTKREVASRISAIHTQISASDINKRRLHSDQKQFFMETQRSFRNLPIHIADTSNLTIAKLKSQARTLVRKHGVKLLVIDYLQLMQGDGSSQSREQEISKIARELKNLAKELDVPVIALSQLSRAVENRDNPRPQLSDLRESGAIEQDANLVMFIYRPEYYSMMKGEEVHPDDRGLAQVLIGKNRDGELGDVDLDFMGQYSYFKDRKVTL